jgi:DNA-binding transcriptional MerR regulator
MGFTTVEVSRETGATMRQLDYWTRNGWINLGEAPGTGNARSWNFRQMTTAKLVVSLIQVGFDVRQAFRCVNQIMKSKTEDQTHRFKLANGITLEFDPRKVTK